MATAFLRFTIIEAPSVLGLFPKGVEMLPDALLAAGFGDGLQALHAGRVEPPQYEDRRDPETKLLNPRGIASYSVALALFDHVGLLAGPKAARALRAAVPRRPR